MKQASPDAKKTGQAPLGVAAAAAATGTTPKPDDKASAKPDAKPDDKTATNGTGAGATGTATGNGAAAEKKARNASKIFIAVGQVYEFETSAKAEKFLNGGGDVPAPAEYAVLRGKRIGTSKKVSLR